MTKRLHGLDRTYGSSTVPTGTVRITVASVKGVQLNLFEGIPTRVLLRNNQEVTVRESIETVLRLQGKTHDKA